MTENLSEMVKDQQEPAPVVFSETDLDLPDPVEGEEETGAPVEERLLIGITPFASWFEANATQFANINRVQVAIRGVNPDETLIMAVNDGTGDEDGEGNPKRNLRVFENADTHPVLDIPASEMQVYNNGFKILYQYNEAISIKCYGVRTGLIAVFCNNINGGLIPYAVTRIKRKDDEIEVVTRDAAEVTAKLTEALDGETLQLRYKQISKDVGDMNTVLDALHWLLTKQSTITDINHHLQIDNVIIETLT